jgi:hypothetical protein
MVNPSASLATVAGVLLLAEAVSADLMSPSPSAVGACRELARIPGSQSSGGSESIPGDVSCAIWENCPPPMFRWPPCPPPETPEDLSADPDRFALLDGTALLGDLPVLPLDFLPRLQAPVAPTGGILQPAPVLSDGQSSLGLCVYALLSLGLFHSAGLVKKLSLGSIPSWYHDGAPHQIGHSHAIAPELRSISIHCFVQPKCKAPERPSQYDRGAIVSLWRKSQFAPALLASRGPPSRPCEGDSDGQRFATATCIVYSCSVI